MKKLMFAAAVVSAFAAFAADAAKPAEAEIEKNEAPIFWGFGSSGVYSGYQLYGSLVNSEPTWQTYIEGNANLMIKDVDFGYLGVGIWSNTDITDKRHGIPYQKSFNEWDFNVHWGKTFWFDDNQTWGLTYRTSVVWYYYPHRMYQKHKNAFNKSSFNTTMDWNHYFELANPYVVPYINVVHEYHESDGNLLQFGLKKMIAAGDNLSFTPYVEMVWRNTNYGWCFPHWGTDRNFEKINSCFATLKIGLDANYQINKYFGVFAKVAYCSVIDGDLRDAAECCTGDDYGKYKDFAWGGVGVSFSF